ncbi:unnamed protein product [Rotaria magnacalcarata]|uniref:Uncharacterized protein n=1 Tax=Rotaria magnacalcarata TaxID=392030 RepID=A0A816NP86_9BILA|nr:unnamed protein product [Rotaria magnacalcarata]CAF1653273.1 unnamed protein product [Rotaria magnacalcarata]CAF2035931.1 unnamed protein product [Rotaria magnacalcarata]CAF2037379.1 unnamed protein product [Rotaria magnacalcarata]CAF2098367.1 unnamed protein product [Rotaria magnacalcarata]
MRFWPPFHTYSIDIISDSPNKLVFRAPKDVRLRMTADHLDLNQNPGSCFTHYNHDTCLWECYHSSFVTGHHRLFIWLLDSDYDDKWAIAVRFDVSIEEKVDSFIYPITTSVFNSLRCQLITPMNGIFSKESLPSEIIVRVPCVHDVQLQIDEAILVVGKSLVNNCYRLEIPSTIPNHVKNFVLMGLRFDDMHYSILITYKIE